MNINKKVILIVILGICACLASFIIGHYVPQFHADSLHRNLNRILVASVLCVLSLSGAMLLARDVIRFVGDRQKNRAKHRVDEKLLSDITENVPGVVYRFAATRDFVYHLDFLSQKTREIFGLEPDPGTFYDEFGEYLPDSEKERFFHSIRDAVERVAPWNYEGRFIRPDGKAIWFSGNSVPRKEGKNIVFDGVLMDITRRKEMESSLRMTRFCFDHAAIGIYQIGMNGRILDVNAYAAEMLGYTIEELKGLSTFDIDAFIHKDTMAEDLKRIVVNERGVVETVHIRKDGSRIEVEIISNILEYEGQKYAFAFVKDVTARKKYEEELKRLRNYLANIIDSMPSQLIGVDKNGRITQWNQTIEKKTGIAAVDAQGKAVADVLPWMASEMRKIFDSIAARKTVQEQRIPRKLDDGVTYEDITIFPLTANGVEGAVIRVDDVTERVRMEEMMVQSEKMLSVGGLAAGMAHEINNPLAGMLQTAEVMAGRLGGNLDIPANRRAAEAAGITLAGLAQFMEARGIPRMLGAVSESGKRVAAIVQNMLTFARKPDASVSSHQLGDLLDATAELAAHDYDLKKQYDFKRIEIRREYAENMLEVPCEAGKIQQVLLNILRNGAQAMQGAGIQSPRFVFRTRVDEDRRMAIMEIEDNGPGMDEKTRRRIFEPFFTTKPVGEGTGLGMSVSYFIITENHGGDMTVDSHPGAGTTFTIRLPVGGKKVKRTDEDHIDHRR